jgi:2-methylisocitrate lyase-like PEP mutase family enzyme
MEGAYLARIGTMKKTLLLKQLLARREAALLPGAANGLFARIIEELGFEACYVTGAGIANMYLGAPDIGLLTMSELANHVSAISDAIELPLLVDADTGFGNAVNTVRTVRVLERAGASGIQLEDQVFPKKCGHFKGKEVVSLDEMLGKIKAAVDSRRDQDFQIIARTDSRAILGIDAAIERGHHMIEAGADVTFVEAPLSEAEMARIARELPVPQIANIVFGGLTPEVGRARLADLGFGGVLYANAALQAAIKGAHDVLSVLQSDGALDRVSHLLAGFEQRQQLVDKAKYDALEARYKSAASANGGLEGSEAVESTDNTTRAAASSAASA